MSRFVDVLRCNFYSPLFYLLVFAVWTLCTVLSHAVLSSAVSSLIAELFWRRALLTRAVVSQEDGFVQCTGTFYVGGSKNRHWTNTSIMTENEYTSWSCIARTTAHCWTTFERLLKKQKKKRRKKLGLIVLFFICLILWFFAAELGTVLLLRCSYFLLFVDLTERTYRAAAFARVKYSSRCRTHRSLNFMR